MNGRRLQLVVLLLALAALGAALGLQKIRTFDYWWHLRTGELIVETGSVPTEDVYTYTVPGNRWVDIHWLFQVGLYGVYALGGHAAVVVGKAAAIVGLLAILGTIGWRRARPAVTVVPLALAVLIAGDRFMPRPELASFLLLAGVLALLDRHERRGGAAVFWIIALQLVWANVHGLFALGIAVCGIAFAAEVVRPIVMPGQAFQRDRVVRLGLVTLGSALVSFVNPNGVDGALYPIQQLQMVGPAEDRGVFGSVIAELIPPLSGQGGLNAFALSLTAALAVLSFGAMVLNWRRASSFDPLAWVAFLYLALGAQRNVALFALVAAPIAVRNANAWLDTRPPRPRLAAAFGWATAAAIALVAVDVGSARFHQRIGAVREPGLAPLDFFYPVQAAEWIRSERPPGPINHHMADGGYLIHALWPDYRVMVDGRLEVFGPETFVQLQTPGVDRFRKLDEEHRFGMVLVHFSLVEARELLRWLYLNPNWRMVQADDTAALFVRQGSGDRRWPEIDPDDPGLFPPFADEPSPIDRVRRMARVNFYSSLHRFDTALALWEETLSLYEGMDQGPVVHAWLLQQAGFPAAAESILREELERRPDDPKLAAQVGELRQDAGDVEGARAMLDRALEIDPNFAFALLRRGMLAEAEHDYETAVLHYTRILATSPGGADPTAISAAARLVEIQDFVQ